MRLQDFPYSTMLGSKCRMFKVTFAKSDNVHTSTSVGTLLIILDLFMYRGREVYVHGVTK